MHRAQSVVNQLVPCVPTIVGRQKFATWLIGPKSRSLIRATQSLPVSENKYSTNVNQEQFLNGTSASYIEDMYNAWLADPKKCQCCKLKYLNSVLFNYIVHIHCVLLFFYIVLGCFF